MTVHGARWWAAFAATLAAASLLARGVAPEQIDWQPGLAFTQPWRAFSAAALHYSGLHLTANLAGVLLVGALGLAAQVPARCAVAWFVAWPLTQYGLLARPDLTHFGGLSGVLHAGVAIVCVHLLWRARGKRRAIGAALAAGLCAKVLSESPWGTPLREWPGWDIAVAPLAHASGVLAGVLCAALAEMEAAGHA